MQDFLPFAVYNMHTLYSCRANQHAGASSFPLSQQLLQALCQSSFNNLELYRNGNVLPLLYSEQLTFLDNNHTTARRPRRHLRLKLH